MICLYCHHPSSDHLPIPPMDPVSQAEARTYLTVAAHRHATHRAKSSDQARHSDLIMDASFANLPCTRGALTKICPCVSLCATEEEAAAYRLRETTAYRTDGKERTPESEARSALTQEMKRLERNARENY